MDKTRVDDMLIEMITPKVKEIEEKFSQGKGLTSGLQPLQSHIKHSATKDRGSIKTASSSGLGIVYRYILFLP
jgi:hypothetical protein